MPPPKTPFEAALATALGLLRARGRSRLEVARTLERRGHPPELVREVVERLCRLGYLDEVAFARARAAALMRGRMGPDAIRQKLLAHGLESAAVEAAILGAASDQDFDPARAARELLVRRKLSPEGLDPKGRARAARLLASRGFSEEVVDALLGGAMVDPLPEDG
ncbi:MAG: recombination regulator RecX [Myxococcota bacterium]|nr:recombination regulator RecX [Myxococcota bacterium]